ncbi:uncharacterized protein UMAG_02751 [Mycosarcoma maydis]|uniref:Uncharacterized protein n=1 Tax=Mycosarcoma maydis TaxID=5270 RepID=A0A0D1E4S7_MYCMD|nr:uncharacterized protein UMAG_02751 [Ustilago maydis 521]KIS69420.1 hypothetical protein UMAG_02751 [Ustilago maydis 521]|eukprot:XP_011389111.1 hypothetical protein UMAG_02751 [Ustilago maydis 521]
MSAQPSSSSSGVAANADASANVKSHHRRTSSLLPSLNSLGSFLAGGLTSPAAASNQDTYASPVAGGALSTDAELVISDPSPTVWADEQSPARSRFGRQRRSDAPRRQEAVTRGVRDLSEEIKFRGPAQHLPTDPSQQSVIAFPAQGSRRPSGSRTSSATSTARGSDTDASAVYSAEPSLDSPDTSATSILYSPRSNTKELPPTPPPPRSESTIKEEPTPHLSSSLADRSDSRYAHQTLPRSFASRSTTSQTDSQQDSRRSAAHARTASLSASTGRCAPRFDPLTSEERTVQRQAGFRARSINSIRGLAAAWVPARFVSSSASETSSDDLSAPDASSPRAISDQMALTKLDNEKSLVSTGQAKRPVKLDRRRLDKAVSLAVEAAQAAEEDERVWEQKQRAKRSAQTTRSRPTSRPVSGDAWSSSFNVNAEPAGVASLSDAEASNTSDSEQDQDDLGFSLDLYISSLGYLISAISDKEAPGLSSKQKQEIRQRLEEGMCKLGFDAKSELEKAQAMKRDLELEREKLQLQRELASPSSSPASVIHHHYHTAMPSSGSYDARNFSRAHAAAKASGRASSSLAGKIGSGVLDVGLHIGAGALSALSANLSAIAPRTARSSAESKGKEEDVRITDLDNGEDLPTLSETDRSSRSASQPGSGAATPRTAWTRAISQNNKQWELAVAFASTAASALATSLGAVARQEQTPAPSSTELTCTAGTLTKEEQMHLARYADARGSAAGEPGETAEDRLILLSASLARALKRSPLPTQLYQLLRQMVSILAAIDAKYSLSEKGTQLAVRETSRAMRFVRRHDLHVKAVRVAWAAAEAAVAALEAYRDERGWIEMQQQQQRIANTSASHAPLTPTSHLDTTPLHASPRVPALAIAERHTLEQCFDDAHTVATAKHAKRVSQDQPQS